MKRNAPAAVPGRSAFRPSIACPDPMPACARAAVALVEALQAWSRFAAALFLSETEGWRVNAVKSFPRWKSRFFRKGSTFGALSGPSPKDPPRPPESGRDK